MEASLNRDKKDLDYLQRKADSNSIKSLELQLIKVKTNLLNEAISSKEEKLKDIRATLEKLLKQTPKVQSKDESVEGKADVIEVKAQEALHPDEPSSAQAEQ
mgnify:CR=1 FL=1